MSGWVAVLKEPNRWGGMKVVGPFPSMDELLDWGRANSCESCGHVPRYEVSRLWDPAGTED